MILEYLNLNSEEFLKDYTLKVFDAGTTIRIELRVTVSIFGQYYYRDISEADISIVDLLGNVIENGSMIYEGNGVYYYNFDTSGIQHDIYGIEITAINGASQIVKTIKRAIKLDGITLMTTTSTSTTTSTTTTL